MFSYGQYLCLEAMQYAATSTNLVEWTETELEVDPSLYEADPGNGVYLDLLHASALADGNYLAVLLKTEYPAMGNLYFRTIRSVLSSDGIVWTSPILIHWLVGTLVSSRLSDVGGIPLFMGGDYPEGWVVGNPYSKCHFYAYSIISNAWIKTFEIDTTPHLQSLFCDDEYFYISYSKHLELWGSSSRATLKSTTGNNWIEIGSNFVAVADSYAGQIVGSTHVFTSGRQWETTTNTTLTEIKYNGNRIVGFQPDALVVSDDFGQTWQRTVLGEFTPLRIIEAQNMYIALIQTVVHPDDPINNPVTWNSSIYTIDSQPTRTQVEGVDSFSMTNDFLFFQTESNGVYQIESQSNLFETVWLPYGLPIAGDGLSADVQLGIRIATQTFFRVRALNMQ